MKTWVAAIIGAVLLCACASFDGRGLVPGQSTQQDVEALMGPAAASRPQQNGETWVYYSRQPFGRVMYVARINPQGLLIALDQRLTDPNIDTIEKGRWVR